METPEKKNSLRSHQFLQPGKIFQSEEMESTSSSVQPETDRKSVPPLFQLPTTDRQGVPQRLQLPTTGRNSIPSLLHMPMTDRQTAQPISPWTTDRQAAQPVSPWTTDRQATPSLYQFPVVTQQHVSFPQSPPTSIPTSPQVQPQVLKKRDVARLEKSTPFIAVILNILIIAGILWMTQNKIMLFPTTHQTSKLSIPTHTTTPALNTITNNKVISPLIFGTNMALFHDYDEPVLNSAATRQLLKNIGVRVMRMPTRMSLSPQTEVNAARAIKEIGAVPLIVINGPEFKGGSLLETNQKTLSLLMPVFGNEPVYFEFGNESDLNGINVEQYVTAWNQVIPSLKQSFPNARFIAPDNYQFSRRYLKTFLQQANPRPDGVSWHEYTCSVNWTAEFCLSLLDTWPIHFAQARAAMHEAIGTELPIWITEWNYASDQQLTNGKPVEDGKYNNPTFMRTWTTRAMQLLIENRIFASLQYYATDQPMALVSQGQIGFEGAIFQQEYQKVMVEGNTPPVMTVSEPPAIPPKNTSLTVSFQNGSTNGWSVLGDGITQPLISTAKAFVGANSLKITLSNASEDVFPIVSISHDALPMVPKAGQMISAYVYVENKAALVNAKLYVAEPNHNFHFSGEITLTPGQWDKVWYALPVNFTGQVAEVGIQFFTSRPGVSSNVYIGGLNIA